MLENSRGKFVFFLVAICSFVLMGFSCLLTFMFLVRGSEEVMVPDVVGKPLTQALQEMQKKELYPRLQLRYSDNLDDKDIVLEQEPDAGEIVKANRRITITVSRGVMLTHIPDYIGAMYDDASVRIKALSDSDGRNLLTLEKAVYKTSSLPEGTIIAQTPAAGTPIVDPISIQFIVSKGNAKHTVEVPSLNGKTVSEILNLMKKTKLTFDFTSHIAAEGEATGAVTSVSVTDDKAIPEYSHVKVDFAFPEPKDDSVSVYGIFSEEVSEYPYPVPMKVTVETPSQEKYELTSFLHKGGLVTVPYSVPRDSVIKLEVNLENK
ncbi:MAG: PASTA domain-containing protein [Treponema sp.]|nr:PASTA domain-containing protein [Treponema sp.]